MADITSCSWEKGVLLREVIMARPHVFLKLSDELTWGQRSSWTSG